MDNKDEFHFFGEWVEYYNEKEKEQAKIYLEWWKKFFLRKVPGLKETNEEQWINKKDVFGKNVSTLGLKIKLKGKKTPDILSLDDITPWRDYLKCTCIKCSKKQ